MDNEIVHHALVSCDMEHDVGPLYYIKLCDRSPGPYKTQLHRKAIIDVADDGTLAGIELIDDMPPLPPLKEPASPWRDIESAPRDGTSIEVWDESPGTVNPAVVFWENGVWVYADNLLADAVPDGALPSHWRQRSEPPR